MEFVNIIAIHTLLQWLNVCWLPVKSSEFNLQTKTNQSNQLCQLHLWFISVFAVSEDNNFIIFNPDFQLIFLH